MEDKMGGTQKWAVMDCSKYPSENNCQMKIMVPADHLDDILDLCVKHAVDIHGHENKPELRDLMRGVITYEER
jgi:hypothetical protein